MTFDVMTAEAGSRTRGARTLPEPSSVHATTIRTRGSPEGRVVRIACGAVKFATPVLSGLASANSITTCPMEVSR